MSEEIRKCTTEEARVVSITQLVPVTWWSCGVSDCKVHHKRRTSAEKCAKKNKLRLTAEDKQERLSRNKKICDRVLLDGKTLVKTAYEFDLSPERVRSIIRKRAREDGFRLLNLAELRQAYTNPDYRDYVRISTNLSYNAYNKKWRGEPDHAAYAYIGLLPGHPSFFKKKEFWSDLK